MEIFSQIDFLLLIVTAGALAGILAGLLGVGGGIVIVPLLYYILNILDYNQSIIMHVAVGTSLFIIIPTSIRSSVEHRVRGSFDEQVFKLWFIPIIIGAALGSLLAIYSSFRLLTFLFAVLLHWFQSRCFLVTPIRGSQYRKQSLKLLRSLLV